MLLRMRTKRLGPALRLGLRCRGVDTDVLLEIWVVRRLSSTHQLSVKHHNQLPQIVCREGAGLMLLVALTSTPLLLLLEK